MGWIEEFERRCEREELLRARERERQEMFRNFRRNRRLAMRRPEWPKKTREVS